MLYIWDILVRPTQDLWNIDFLRYSKFYPKKVIQKKLSTNKSREKFYPEVLSTNFFIQNVPDLFDITLYH